MPHSHIKSALLKKSKLLCSIKHYKQLIKTLNTNLGSFNSTISIFESDYKLGYIKAVNIHNEIYILKW